MKRKDIAKLVIFMLLCFTGFAQPAGTNLYYGLLHAHTMLSDGSGTPEEAYQKAKAAGLHFFAITEHNHDKAESGAKDRKDDILIANNHALYNGNGTVTVTPSGGNPMTIKSLKKAAQDATTSQFLALYGQEFSTISSGNHMNVINAKDVITVPSGNFKKLYEWIEAANDNSIIVQMNHPNVNKDMFGSDADHDDYGIDETELGLGFGELTANTDRYIQLIEILSGPAMAKTSNPNYRYTHTNENDYFFYLKQGFHIAPSAGQDNHYKTWGTSSNARIGVFATSLTKDGLAQALKKYCTFVTEDKNLSVYFSVNGSAMGSNITALADQTLDMQIKISDADDASPVYVVEIYGGAIEPTTYVQTQKLVAKDGLIAELERTGNGTVSYSLASSGDAQFYYVKIIEKDRDRAWSAPIWVNSPEGGAAELIASSDADVFFWTRNPSSRVYHVEGCPSIKTISSKNLISGANPPGERSQHDCPVEGH